MSPKRQLQKEGAPLAPPPTTTIRQDKVWWLSVVTYLGLIAVLWTLHICYTPQQEDATQRVAAADGERLKVTVFDAIALPGSKTAISAKYEKNLPGPVNPDKEGLAVVLGAITTPEHRLLATTDDEGIATAALVAPKEPGSYVLFSHAQEQSSYAQSTTRTEAPLLFVIPADKKILICDIDGTVTDGEAFLKGVNLDPQEHAATVLNKLAAQYSIIYITARDDMLLNKSRNWLAKHRFPRAPVLCRDWTLSTLTKTGDFKTRAIKELQKHFTKIEWAIGNSQGDRDAYAATKIPHVIIHGKETKTVNGVARHGVDDWRKVEKIILGDGK